MVCRRKRMNSTPPLLIKHPMMITPVMIAATSSFITQPSSSAPTSSLPRRHKQTLTWVFCLCRWQTCTWAVAVSAPPCRASCYGQSGAVTHTLSTAPLRPSTRPRTDGPGGSPPAPSALLLPAHRSTTPSTSPVALTRRRTLPVLRGWTLGKGGGARYAADPCTG